MRRIQNFSISGVLGILKKCTADILRQRRDHCNGERRVERREQAKKEGKATF